MSGENQMQNITKHQAASGWNSAIRTSVIIALMSLSGCATWQKPGVSKLELDHDTAVCEARAASRVPVELVQRLLTPAHWADGRLECDARQGERPGEYERRKSRGNRQEGKIVYSRDKMCWQEYYWVEDTYTTDDINRNQRDSVMAVCMTGKGYILK